MIRLINDWWRNKRNPPKREFSREEYAYWQNRIDLRQQRVKEAEKIVGSSPLDQIDFICEHGFAKFNEIMYNEKEEEQEENWLIKGMNELQDKSPEPHYGYTHGSQEDKLKGSVEKIRAENEAHLLQAKVIRDRIDVLEKKHKDINKRCKKLNF